MKYVKPLKLYQQLMSKNATMKKPNQCHRLLGLDMRDYKYLNLAVSNPENTIAAPLCTVGRQENDMGLMVDKLQTLISEYNAVGFVVRYPYYLHDYSRPNSEEVKIFVDDLCKTKKMEGLIYTYWDHLITLKDMDFVLDHHIGFICEQLNQPEDVSKKIREKFRASQVLQGYLNCADMMLEYEKEEDNAGIRL